MDIGATTFHATLAADYILAVVDDYLEAERERIEKDLQEVIDFCLGAQADADRRSNPALAHRIAEDCHRALCQDQTHCHEENPWSSAQDEGTGGRVPSSVLATAARSARENWSAVGFLTPAPVGAAGVRLSYGESGV